MARTLAGKLLGGEVVALRGELGSGKTCFTQGLARGLGVKGRVRSPSFIVMAGYKGRLKLYHFDFYRLRAEEELEEIGLARCCRADAVVVVEWADRFPAALPAGTMWLEMEWHGEQERKISFGKGFTPDERKRILNPSAMNVSYRWSQSYSHSSSLCERPF